MAPDLSEFHEKTKNTAILIHDLQYVLNSANTSSREKPYIQETLASLKKQYLGEYNNFVKEQTGLSAVFQKAPAEEKKRAMLLR